MQHLTFKEESRWTLPEATRDVQWWNGGTFRPLLKHENRHRDPYLVQLGTHQHVQLTDHVGKNTFRVICEDGSTQEQVIFIEPKKLSAFSEETEGPWHELKLMLEDLPRKLRGLEFPHELLLALTPHLQTSYYLDPLDLWADLRFATSSILRAPQSTMRHLHSDDNRVLLGEVDWERTLETWADGEKLGRIHVSRETVRQWNLPGNQALLAVWTHLCDQLGEVQVTQQAREVQALLSGVQVKPLPEMLHLANRSLPAAYRPLQRILSHLSSHTVFEGEPQTHYPMNVLYECWCAVRVAVLLGCTRLKDHRVDEGRHSCIFQGDTYTLHFNPKFVFRGVGKEGEEFANQPDLYLHSNDPAEKVRVVLDVKYRPIPDLRGTDRREINNQLLIYMGSLQCSLGLAVWPGQRMQPPLTVDLPRGAQRGRLGLLTLNPTDSDQVLQERLKAIIHAAGGDT